MAPQQLVVVSVLDVSKLEYDSGGNVIIPKAESEKDALDPFNHPRVRRALIMTELGKLANCEFRRPEAEQDLSMFNSVHSQGLLEFLLSSWSRWEALGVEGQDPSGCIAPSERSSTPALGPNCVPLPREVHLQRPSKHVIGQMGYYVTDTCTPVFAGLRDELLLDAATVRTAVEVADPSRVVYAMPTHPGHHSSRDGFGGYCYVNNVAAAAQFFKKERVAILDIDYHAGNGTASIFYSDPSVLVVSIHCDPDYDYPFHSGFSDERGDGAGKGTTLHLPLPPKTTWKEYKVALEQAMQNIRNYDPQALIVSMGLDTYNEDPCSIRRAGFCLEGDDYKEMGKAIASGLNGAAIPVIFFQEGGYRMEKIASAATDVVNTFREARN